MRIPIITSIYNKIAKFPKQVEKNRLSVQYKEMAYLLRRIVGKDNVFVDSISERLLRMSGKIYCIPLKAEAEEIGVQNITMRRLINRLKKTHVLDAELIAALREIQSWYNYQILVSSRG